MSLKYLFLQHTGTHLPKQITIACSHITKKHKSTCHAVTGLKFESVLCHVTHETSHSLNSYDFVGAEGSQGLYKST